MPLTLHLRGRGKQDTEFEASLAYIEYAPSQDYEEFRKWGWSGGRDYLGTKGLHTQG